MTSHALDAAGGPTLTDWLDTDEHRDQAWNLHQHIADREGPYAAAAWLIGASTRPTRNGHSTDARAAAHAHINAREQQ
ncbi:MULTISPECIES: hypothetical protein [unclassified Streptomyces]|uniref:hypothetical protein n=1 Tax=unclassified Streptomyces TaxID=2593676 RepID=UPI00087F7B14|nr:MULTISPECIES: hypothetical protein [unclassified Streptomyces]PBC72296.1 hypothetical protein BX261_7380 [Streptomyces sp. 2321.6]SDR62267.1 hypothetical protein SAMN05216511_7323 [Streptomyces sp. KS_16]SEE51463.1 hypothetical protein SAMN05428940_7372 [Streptomyces sp. 2133.1]SNC77800.1 hypothetical protein SAMN06272741_7216 [Streptomyces sp. 2114.4]